MSSATAKTTIAISATCSIVTGLWSAGWFLRWIVNLGYADGWVALGLILVSAPALLVAFLGGLCPLSSLEEKSISKTARQKLVWLVRFAIAASAATLILGIILNHRHPGGC